MNYIQETAFSSIIELISGGVKEIKNIKNAIRPGTSYRSIAQRSSNFVLVFPTLVSKSLSIESASMINKALERKQVQMLQILFAAHQLQQVDNPEEFLKQFHTNIEKTEFTVDDVLNGITNRPVAEATDFILTEAQVMELAALGQKDMDYTLADSISEQGVDRFFVRNGVVQEVTRKGGKSTSTRKTPSYTTSYTDIVSGMADPRGFTPSVYSDIANGKSVSKDFIEANKNNMNVADHIMKQQKHAADMVYNNHRQKRENWQDQYNVSKDKEARDFRNKQFEYQKSRDVESQDFRNKQFDYQKAKDVESQDFRNKQFDYQKSRDAESQDFRNKQFDYQKSRDTESQDFRNKQFEYQKQRDAENDLRLNQKDDFEKEKQAHKVYQDKLANAQQDVRTRMLDAEVKKENELVGSPMMVTLKVLKPGATQHEPVSFVVVVKSKLNPVESRDVIDRIVNKNRDNQYFNQFVRAATSEISWGRDFLFAVDKARLDALSNSKKSTNRLFKVLERRGTYSRFKRRTGLANNAMAITTLVVSQEEVELMKKENRIDLENVSVANGILEAYNLLCLVIVDETNESAKFLFDSGENRFETLSFNALEKENKSDFKKMVTLMNKMK